MKQIGLQGICYDDKSSFMKGPAQAPPLIRKAFYSSATSMMTETGVHTDGVPWLDFGDQTVEIYDQIEQLTKDNLLQCDHLITLGGDHSITYPILRALSKKHGQFSILQIDAHTDLYDSYQGDEFSHACPFARIMEDELAEQLVQVGIRTTNGHQRDQIERFDVEVIYAKEISEPIALPDLKAPVYVSLDLDALDPAYAPGVSHHEPGGLSTRQVLSIIHQIQVPIIGADIVEYNPLRDLNEMTAAVAAKFLKEIMGKMVLLSN